MVGMSEREPVRLRGMASRADEPQQPIGPGVTLPDSVVVTLEFSRDHVVGTATLRRDDAGNILADATVYLDADPMLRKGMAGRRLWPYFALGITRTVVTKDDVHPMGVITGGQVATLALTVANSDPDLPPYLVLTTFEPVMKDGEIVALSLPAPPFTCPRCGMTSHNPNDIREGYCGNCHDWTGARQ